MSTLDYIQQRDGLNRNSATDRRREERRCTERRGEDRRKLKRRSVLNGAGDARPVSVDRERRKDDRRQLARRQDERRALERRTGERRRDPSRIRRFPLPDGGFLTQEERDFLQSVLRQSSDE